MENTLDIIRTTNDGFKFSVVKEQKILGSFTTKMQGYILLLDLFYEKQLIPEDVLELTEKIHDNKKIGIILNSNPVTSYHSDMTDQSYFMNLSIAEVFIDFNTVSQVPGVIEYCDDYEYYAKIILFAPKIEKHKYSYRAVLPRVRKFYSHAAGLLLVMKYLMDLEISLEQADYLKNRIIGLNLPKRLPFKVRSLF
jgi:hypothetical protein